MPKSTPQPQLLLLMYDAVLVSEKGVLTYKGPFPEALNLWRKENAAYLKDSYLIVKKLNKEEAEKVAEAGVRVVCCAEAEDEAKQILEDNGIEQVPAA